MEPVNWYFSANSAYFQNKRVLKSEIELKTVFYGPASSV